MTLHPDSALSAVIEIRQTLDMPLVSPQQLVPHLPASILSKSDFSIQPATLHISLLSWSEVHKQTSSTRQLKLSVPEQSRYPPAHLHPQRCHTEDLQCLDPLDPLLLQVQGGIHRAVAP